MFRTERSSETCSVIVLNKIKFETLVHVVGFTIEIYYDAQPYERQTITPKMSNPQPSDYYHIVAPENPM